MTVNLDLLREQMRDAEDDIDVRLRPSMEDALYAVLAAPRVWWCETHQCDAGTDPNERPDECAIVYAWKEGFRGWWTPKGECAIAGVVLVPVEGEGNQMNRTGDTDEPA